MSKVTHMLRGAGICTEMYQCKAWTHYISTSAHMCGCDTTHTHTQRHTHTLHTLHTSLMSRVRYEEEIQPIGSTTEDRVRVSALPVSLLFTQSSWRCSSWLPLNEPPAGCLNHPLINPSVGSLLRPQPSEEGSNPAKQKEGRLSEGRAGKEEDRIVWEGLFYYSFDCKVGKMSQTGKEVICPH